MNAMTRTIVFVVVAAVSVGLAALTNALTKPASVAGFERVGELFYPDFKDPLLARAIRVAAFDDKTSEPVIFNVEFKNGRWRIPSHHDYPAEGGERLARTAASVIGITRGAIVSRRATDHTRFGVVDPMDPKSATASGHGQRVTLYNEADKALADYIIGKKIKGRSDEYYVRRADEDHTYIAKLKIDLSTKFADWIEPDLLKLDSDKLVALSVRQPFADPITGDFLFKTSELTREASGQPWDLKGLDEETEEVKTAEVTKMVNAVDDLKILGVRPKPAGINADLSFSVPASYARNPAMASSFRESLLRNLASRGFFVDEDSQGNQHILSREGEVTAGTSEGVLYHLHFGNVFSGSLEEIEVGKTGEAEAETLEEGKAEKKPEADKKDESGEQEDANDSPENGAKAKSGSTDSRYLFVRVEFDPALLGPEPVAPTEPQKPAGLDDAPAKDGEKKDAVPPSKEDGAAPAADEKDADSKEPASEAADPAKAEEPPAKEDKPADEKPEAKPAEDNPAETKPDPKAEYEKALADYAAAKAKYDSDKTAYDSKATEGRKKVDELNQRFGEWYYVISASSFSDLRLARSDLVKPKEKQPDETKPDEVKSPDNKPPFTPSTPETPDDAPAEAPKPEPQKPAEPKPAADNPAPEKPAGSADVKPEPESKPEQKSEE